MNRSDGSIRGGAIALAMLIAVAIGSLALLPAVATDVPISDWFFIVTSFGSLFMVSGKRGAEARELDEGGIDASAEEARGALILITKCDGHLKGGSFDPKTMITMLNAAVEDALAAPDAWMGFCGFFEHVCAMQAADQGVQDVLTTTFPTARAALSGLLRLMPSTLRASSS